MSLNVAQVRIKVSGFIIIIGPDLCGTGHFLCVNNKYSSLDDTGEYDHQPVGWPGSLQSLYIAFSSTLLQPASIHDPV